MKLSLVMILIVILSLATISQASAADPVGKVETTLAAEKDLWVGQRVPLTIKILAPGFSIEGIPAFDLREIPGLLVLKLPGAPRIGNETVEEVTYVTQVHEFALFPQRAGEFTVPAFPVRFSSSAGYGKPVTTFTVKTQPLKFSASLPPGAENLRTLISTRRLTVEESWSPNVTSGKVGDAVTRTITMKADDIPGMEFPPLARNSIKGLGIYPKQPVVTDTSDRGSLNGQRVESVTYVFEVPGNYTLPGFSLTWWNLDTKVLKQATIEERMITVSDPVGATQTTRDRLTESRRTAWVWIGCLFVMVGSLAIITTIFLRRKPDYQRQKEKTLFDDLETACRSGDRAAIFAALTAWADHVSSGPVQLSEWALQSSDTDLANLVRELEADLYRSPGTTPETAFPAHALFRQVRRFRHRIRARSRNAGAAEQLLTPLNP